MSNLHAYKTNNGTTTIYAGAIADLGKDFVTIGFYAKGSDESYHFDFGMKDLMSIAANLGDYKTTHDKVEITGEMLIEGLPVPGTITVESISIYTRAFFCNGERIISFAVYDIVNAIVDFINN